MHEFTFYLTECVRPGSVGRRSPAKQREKKKSTGARGNRGAHSLKLNSWTIELAFAIQSARWIFGANKYSAIRERRRSRSPIATASPGSGRKRASVCQCEFSVAIIQQHCDLLMLPSRADQHVQGIVAIYIPRHNLQPAGRRNHTKHLHGTSGQLQPYRILRSAGGVALLDFHGRQVRFSVPVEIRDSKTRVESSRRNRRLTRRRAGRVCPASHTKNQTENQASPEKGSCQPEPLMHPREHELQFEEHLLETNCTIFSARIPFPAGNLPVFASQSLPGTNAGPADQPVKKRQVAREPPAVSQNAHHRSARQVRSYPPQFSV
jgi:hypothetical protein